MKAADQSRKGRASKTSGAQTVTTPTKASAAKKAAAIEFGKTALKFGFLGLLFCAFFVAVWSGGASPVPVSGLVTYNDKPLPNVNVIFMGKGSAIARGITDENGRFEYLTTKEPRDGAFPGDYAVAITPQTPDSNLSATTSYEVPSPPPFPSRYLSATTSRLTFSVVASGQNRFKLELKD